MDVSDQSDCGSDVSNVSGNKSKTNDITDGSVKSKERGTSSKTSDPKTKYGTTTSKTRGKTADLAPISKLKKECLERPLEEKRTKYRCGPRYMTLEDIPTWEEYYLTIKKPGRAKSGRKNQPIQPVKEVNKKLNSKVSLWTGDITTLEIDAIANAANNTLLGGGGVDGAIHSAAGSLLLRECSEMHKKGCKTGDAKITAGYNLPAKYVIHTVGPMVRGFGPNAKDKDLLQNCYKNCLKHVEEEHLNAIAFPCISTGIYGYPHEKATIVALETVREWLEKDGIADSIQRVIFCLFLPIDVELYETNMMKYFPKGDTGGSAQEREQELATQSAGDKSRYKEQTKKNDTSSEPKISDNQEKSADMATSESDTEAMNVPPTGEEQNSPGKQDVNLKHFKPKQKKRWGLDGSKSGSDKKDKAKTEGRHDSPEQGDVVERSRLKAQKPVVKSASTRGVNAPKETSHEAEPEIKNGARPGKELNTSADAPMCDAEKKKLTKDREKTLGESPENKKQKSAAHDEEKSDKAPGKY